MAANKNWVRWIVASLSKWFDAHRSGLYMYVEGEDADAGGQQDYFEFRLNGPLLEQFSRGWWRFDVVVNTLVVSKRNDSSAYTIYANVGVVMAAFETNVPIYRYGDGPDDDRTELLGCMTLSGELEVVHLGQVNPDIKEQQSMVEGHYRMFIEG